MNFSILGSEIFGHNPGGRQQISPELKYSACSLFPWLHTSPLLPFLVPRDSKCHPCSRLCPRGPLCHPCTCSSSPWLHVSLLLALLVPMALFVTSSCGLCPHGSMLTHVPFLRGSMCPLPPFFQRYWSPWLHVSPLFVFRVPKAQFVNSARLLRPYGSMCHPYSRPWSLPLHVSPCKHSFSQGLYVSRLLSFLVQLT